MEDITKRLIGQFSKDAHDGVATLNIAKYIFLVKALTKCVEDIAKSTVDHALNLVKKDLSDSPFAQWNPSEIRPLKEELDKPRISLYNIIKSYKYATQLSPEMQDKLIHIMEKEEDKCSLPNGYSDSERIAERNPLGAMMKRCIRKQDYSLFSKLLPITSKMFDTREFSFRGNLLELILQSNDKLYDHYMNFLTQKRWPIPDCGKEINGKWRFYRNPQSTEDGVPYKTFKTIRKELKNHPIQDTRQCLYNEELHITSEA